MSWGVAVLAGTVYLPLGLWLLWVWRSGRWREPAQGGKVQPYKPKHRGIRFHLCDPPLVDVVIGVGRVDDEPEPWRCPLCSQQWIWNDEWVPDIVDAMGPCDIGGPVGWVRCPPSVQS